MIGFDYMKIIYKVDGYEAFTSIVDSVKDTLTPYVFYGVCCSLTALAFLILEEEIPVIVKYFTK